MCGVRGRIPQLVEAVHRVFKLGLFRRVNDDSECG